MRRHTIRRAVEALEPRRLLASVALFDDPFYVDTAGFFDSEADNIRASLTTLGHSVTPFTGVAASDFAAALAGKDLLLIPEQEISVLAPDLSPEARTVIRDYVAGGGGLIINGFAGDTPGTLNAIFGYELTEVFGSTAQRTFEATATQFAASPATLPANDGTSALPLVSLPDDAFPIYSNGTDSTVTLFRYGAGEIVFLGWDWYFSIPPNSGGQNNGWQQVLGAAVSELVTDPNPNAPRADAGGPYGVDEGGSLIQVPLDSSGSTDPNQAANTLTYAWDLDLDGAFGETGAVATRGNEVGPSPTFAATASEFDGPTGFRVLLKVTDSSGLNGYSSANIRVRNVAPTATISGPGNVAPGAFAEFMIGATDPSSVDTGADFGFEIDWGDGTGDFFFGAGAGFNVGHVFSLSGSRTILVTAIDKDGGRSEPAPHTVTVVPASIAPDPLDPDRMVLFIAGTESNDVIRVTRKNSKRAPTVVTINGVTVGSFDFVGPISIASGPGNDDVAVAAGIAEPAEIDLGEGNDTGSGGAGPDVILGRDGSDVLGGNSGRDLLIGGVGADNLSGGDGDDLLLAGGSDYEFDTGGRRLIMAEWTRTDQSYVRRGDHLRFGGGFNGFALLTSFDDGDVDVLSGGKNDDWFFWHGSSPVRDTVRDLGKNEFSTEIFF